MPLYDSNISMVMTEIGEVLDATTGTVLSPMKEVYDANMNMVMSVIFKKGGELLTDGVFQEDYSVSTNNDAHNATITQKSGYISLKMNSEYHAMYFGYYLDLTNVKTLYIKFKNVPSSGHSYSSCGIAIGTTQNVHNYLMSRFYDVTSYGGIARNIIYASGQTNTTVTLDVSSYSGNYWCWFGCYNHDGGVYTWDIEDFGYEE